VSDETDRSAPPRPTLEEVASLAGVSIATVSRVLNESAPVSPSTRDAVVEAVAQLGYVPNPAARSLVRRRTDTIALVLSEPESLIFSDPFFATVVHGVLAAVADTELQVVLLLAQGERQQAKVERYVRHRHVDGLILMALHAGDTFADRLADANVPIVLVGRPQSSQRLPYVDADNRAGAREATELLLASGRTRVATITGPLDMNVAADRFDGYRDALPAGGAELVEGGDFTVAGAERAMQALLARVPDLDAVFVASDPMAVGALHALRAAGRRVPDDVAVVGFDDAPVARTTRPPLTTVSQPLEEMTRALTDLLLRRIAGEAAADERVVFPTALVRRGSA